MSRRNTTLIKSVLGALHFSGADRLLAPLTRGNGVIFTLHHVRPEPPQAFEPNRILKITPEFLDAVIRQVLELGFEIVSLDGVHERLVSGRVERPYACFTFDDGYRDNRDHAYPVFKRHNLPFAIYAATEFADGTGDLWWLALEEAIRRAPAITLQMDGDVRRFMTATAAAKGKAFHEIYWWLRTLPEHRARAVVRELAMSAGYDPSAVCRELVMNWDEMRELAKDPLVTIGAHTKGHWALAKLSENAARAEMRDSIKRVSQELGRPCRHFSYPYGDAESAGLREFEVARALGLKTAVTTRKGLLRAVHGRSLTHLPRVSLNGDYQDERYIRVMLSGAPFALMDAIGREKVAAAG